MTAAAAVRPARRRLHSALVEACVATGFDQVTVVDLVERAGVSRATFYRHYEDKFALLREVVEPGLSRLRAGPAQPAGRPGDRVASDVQRLLEHVARHLPLFRSLLLRRTSPWFQRWLCQELSRLHWLPGDRLVRSALGWALVGLVTEWVEADARDPAELVARRYVALLDCAAVSRHRPDAGGLLQLPHARVFGPASA